MKSIFVACAIALSTISAHAVVMETAAKLSGEYVAQGNCLFETARVSNQRRDNMDIFTVALSNPSQNLYRFRSINMDNMFTRVRTTRGMQRIVTQDVVRGNKMIAEEKTCLPGWVGCSEFKTAMAAVLVDDSTMDVTMGEESCTFSRVR